MPPEDRKGVKYGALRVRAYTSPFGGQTAITGHLRAREAYLAFLKIGFHKIGTLISIPQNPDIVKPDVNINKVTKNNLNKNNMYYNHSLTQKQPAKPEQREGEIITEEDIYFEVRETILNEKQLPYHYILIFSPSFCCNTGVMLKKASPSCFVCGAADRLIKIGSANVCAVCREKLKDAQDGDTIEVEEKEPAGE